MNLLVTTRRLALASLVLLVVAVACSDPDDGDATDDNANTTPGGDNGGSSNGDGAYCTPGEMRCDGVDNIETCDDDGDGWSGEPCPAGERCNADTAACSEEICSGGEFDACTDDGLARHCNASGTDLVDVDCPGNTDCSDGQCAETECTPGTSRCGSAHSLETCSDAGVWVAADHCPFGTECFDGECEELCEISSKIATYIGCEYWSIDLDNFQEALSEPHAIIVTNYNEDLEAEVRLFEGHSERQILTGADGQDFDTTIPPGQARIFEVAPGFGHAGTRKFDNEAIRVTSSIPVVAHQFNPLNHVEVYSNDGSLLLPTDSVGTEYWAMGWYNRSDSVELRGYLTMVNSSTVDNEVTVRPTTEVLAGPDIATIDAGEERTFSLAPGQSLNLVSSSRDLADAQVDGCLADPEGSPDSVEPCPDLTGTHIEADHPITLFGGHQCANIPLGVDRCDHIESLLPPVDTWGTEYVGTKFEPRTATPPVEPDIWRVIAAEDDTRIQTDPPIDGIHDTRLDAGEWKQFAVRHDFEIVGEDPIFLAQYMVGANWPGIPRVCDDGLNAFQPTGIGDPAMSIAVPTDQFRTDYIVHIPENYDENYLDVVVPIGEDVTVDGEPIPAGDWEVVGEMNRYEVAAVEVDAGFYTLESDEPFGVVAYGYACHVSYAYPGGMDLEPIQDHPSMP